MPVRRLHRLSTPGGLHSDPPRSRGRRLIRAVMSVALATQRYRVCCCKVRTVPGPQLVVSWTVPTGP